MTENQLIQTNKVDRIVGVLYVISALLGNFFIVDIKILGIVPTYFRVLVPLCFLYYLIKRFRESGALEYYNKRYVVFIGFLILMMTWGLMALFVGEYVDKNEGMKSLFELGLGFLSIIIIYEICLRQNGFRLIIYTTRVVIVALTILAIVEMSTAVHLFTSKYSDPEYVEAYLKIVKDIDLDGKISCNATGIFYNENDFSAFLGLFVPIFFPQKFYRLRTKILCCVELALILVILAQNDAWICMFSPIIGTVAYLLLIRAKIRVWVASIIGFAVVKMFGVNTFAGLAYMTYKIIPGIDAPLQIENMFREGSSKLPDVLEGQLIGVEHESGSAYTRTHTYLEGVKRTITDSHGLRFGPGSYSNYVNAHPESGMLANPHSMWLELLMQYGVIITIIFVILILGLFLRMCVLYHETHRREYAVIIAMDIIFVLICFAPSNYFGISYTWIPIGLSLAFANIRLNSIKPRRGIPGNMS